MAEEAVQEQPSPTTPHRPLHRQARWSGDDEQGRAGEHQRGEPAVGVRAAAAGHVRIRGRWRPGEGSGDGLEQEARRSGRLSCGRGVDRRDGCAGARHQFHRTPAKLKSIPHDGPYFCSGIWSFGHFPASRSGVHKGGLHWTLVKASFVATRISVTSLNQEIVRALAREGIPYVGMSPFACGWSTSQRKECRD
ncbi:hypothetical protein PAHAL_2G215700 [Panicum hallii]|uniref:Uncharacterized protein n=1 Tax=Panicum hallii TaxID=206008 RepID=A0A2T8KPV7_9POAL|nr:hypothetical protein PAHAL_2G215500 [Panicum hallii]PAN11769.1 hypothetical protein PAHAL_2G215500 [Panicum hallii]PVH64212.1 hypothetical protein PAHAL_2G215700 [Panicum hallii]PVH64213.1 hypothetical protein PAHAL_2G215700 [Panicum hallii]